MPVYNAAPYLAEAITSILEQTFSDFELLIVNDGSTDGSKAVISSFDDQRLRVITHDRNQGLVASLNDGLDKARGTYIARMDADDVMRADRLAIQFAFMAKNSEIDVVASFVDLMNAEGVTTGVWDTDRAAAAEEDIRNVMAKTNCIAHPSVLIRKESLGLLRYSTRQSGCEDWDLWMRVLARGGRIAKIPEALLNYRVHASSVMSGEKKNVPLERRLLRARWRTLLNEWQQFHFSSFHVLMLVAQAHTFARHSLRNVLTPLARGAYRLLTYSPFKLHSEQRALERALSEWNGSILLNFPYVNVGGAEKVHADILASVADQKPLTIISGFSRDRGFASRFAQHGRLLEIPRLLHHPFTRKRAHELLARKINSLDRPVLFASLSAMFYDLLPLLKPEVRTFYLQHAFLFQPNGNLKHRSWLQHFPRVDGYVFVSQHAKGEFEKLLFANNIPRSAFTKLRFLSNAVDTFSEVREHDRLGVLFVGRDSEEKRLRLFLSIADDVTKRAPGRFRFTVVGSDTVPGHEHVRFKGSVDDPHALSVIYAEHDALALTSSREGFPMVIMEAMAHGLTVISTPVGDVPGRLDDRCAMITSSVEEGAVLGEMTNAILGFDADRERLRRMRKTALEKAEEEFDPQAFREAYRSLLISPASAT